MLSRRRALFVLLFISIALIAYSAAFSYRYVTGYIEIGRPAVWFEDPRTPGVAVQLYRNNTDANITITPAPEIVLAKRSAIYNDTFDTNPLGTRLLILSDACTWHYDKSPRYYIHVHTNDRSNASWDYWCIAIVNPSYLNITDYVINGSSVYVAFMTWYYADIDRAQPTIKVSAIYLSNMTTPTFYAIGYKSKLLSGTTGNDHYSNIYYWRNPNSYTISDVPLGISYILEQKYLSHVSTGIDFGNWVAYHYVNSSITNWATIPEDNRTIPYTIGIGYRWLDRRPPDERLYFDNLVVTVDSPPWYINVTGLPNGWRAVLRNSTGAVVSNATAYNGVAVLYTVPDQPIYIDDLRSDLPEYLIFRNAAIEIYDANNNLVISRTFDYLIGGDLYLFRWSFNGTALSIYSNMSSGFYGMLANATAQIISGVNASVGLRDRNGVVSSVNITVVNGALISSETNAMYISPPAQWSNKWLAFNITSSFAIYGLSPPVTYNIQYNFIWWVGDGVYVVYPVNVTVVIS